MDEVECPQLNSIDKGRIHTTSHAQSYQERMARSVNNKRHPRSSKEGDLLLNQVWVVKHLDPRGKFNPNLEDPNIIISYTGSTVLFTDLDGREELKAANADRLKKYYT
ncbi:hypothetical protein C5167_011010 [Papaver somniferum]|uniref:Uncharacterized protein n=1 Tax=Papaver somniferum TaxID=3469 RepID=A0A4Y7K1T7_PAPSO|nr:hypothetical protein C5167_011010 [Papaver somniferum]